MFPFSIARASRGILFSARPALALGVIFTLVGLLGLVGCGSSDDTTDVPDTSGDAAHDVPQSDVGCDDGCPAIGVPISCEGNLRVGFVSVQDPVTCECSNEPFEEDCGEIGRTCEGGACVLPPEGCTDDMQCVGASAPVCDGDDLVGTTGFCNRDTGECEGQEVRSTCPHGCRDSDDGSACMDEPAPACTDDDECAILGRPVCEGFTVVGSEGICDTRTETCTIVETREHCDFGCEDDGTAAPPQCIEENPCPDAQCEGEPVAPSCDGNVWNTPLVAPDPDACDSCIVVDQLRPCRDNQVCDDDLGCVLDTECDICPVFDPGPPRCEGDVVVEDIGIELDPETCDCNVIQSRTDCAEDGRTCENGACVAGM